MKNQTFGIEIETTGIGRERTAKAIAAYFGTTARYVGRHLDDWKVPMPDGRHWTVERDGSVTDPSAEVVSPVCRYSHLCRNRPIAQIPAPQRLNLLALPKRDRHCQPSFTFPTEATVFRSVRRRMFPCNRPLAGQALK